MSARSRATFLSAAIGAALLAGPALASHDLTEVDVPGHHRAPTQVTISLAGKSVDAVRVEVRDAARTVCRNAVSNGDLDLGDLWWCRAKSASKAMVRYEALRADARQTAGAATIVLSSR